MKFNVTIASPSPLIALGSLIFNGTSIWLDSVWQTQSVPYTVYLDSTEFASVRSPSNDLLYHTTNLDQNEQHTVIIQPARLLDSVIVEMDLGAEADVMMSMDDGQLFQQAGFVATGQWNTDACLGAGRAAGTCHVSEGSGSEISYTFEGDAITLWGAAENQYSLYQVSIDGVRPISFTPSNTTTSRPVTILAHYSNLGFGSHTIKLTSLPKDGKSRVEVDYAQVYTKSSIAGSTPVTTGSTASSTALPAAESSSHLSKSAIIAIVVGTLLGVLALVGLFFIYKLRQKNKAIAAARRRDAAVAAAGVRVDFSARRSRDFDEATLASSRFSVKEGLELSVIESQAEARRPEEAAKGGFTWRS
ncbi:hypothetical protein M407DRAFT_20252 [Tulasnella calospora MUT 4182]|uniref:Uncharacterized protein n=1 Tax=Tulasnella calospora MUT 4182 TaxID=1051891 RepID=A0A0C3MAL2_9AGAM|nr:hypothetical protein M407DRAFT_20252 [Tulasnella calospora MUT 4182]